MVASRGISLIAPCGMNCGICRAYLREKKKCPGCRGEDANKNVACVNCKIKNCVAYKNTKSKYCFACDDYPCDKLRHLDKRYRKRYNMSMIANLDNIKSFGIKRFIKNEKARWSCAKCGGTICVHGGYCFECGKNKEFRDV